MRPARYFFVIQLSNSRSRALFLRPMPAAKVAVCDAADRPYLKVKFSELFPKNTKKHRFQCFFVTPLHFQCDSAIIKL